MEKQSLTKAQIYSIVGAITVWFAVTLQLYLIILNRTMPVLQTIIKFFSFFTILSNILVALAFTLILNPESKWRNFFTSVKTLTAITVYITVVGLTYNLILRQLWQPQGLQRLVDELLHVVTPILFILHWVFFVSKTQLKWKDIYPWLIFPIVYTIYIFIRGAISGEYPYPFMDVNTLGYNVVIKNSVGVSMVFILVSAILVGIGKLVAKYSHK